ncbi:MAG: hypothetical protein NWQ54_17660 [Paraglaciecola sp.]|nr:hypothetical protein [Paraglaciecola sp.]
MNDGKLLKKIFTFGDSSGAVTKNFVKDWQYNWVEHIHLTELTEEIFNTSDDHEFFSLYVIDINTSSLDLFESIASFLKYRNNFEVIAISEKSLSLTQIGILSRINDICEYSKIKLVGHESLPCILECYAHVLCGWSYTCIDFNDTHEWLHAGTTFLSAGSYIDLAVKNELPYMLYLQLAELKAKYENLDLEVAALNVVFLGAYISQDLFVASLAMVSGNFGLDLNLTVHSNIQEANQNGKVGFKIFASLTKKSISTQLSETDAPAFLRE